MSDPTTLLKEELLKASEEYREEIKEGLKVFSESIGKKGMNALIVSGSLLAGYLIYKALTREGEEEDTERTTIPITTVQQPNREVVVSRGGPRLIDRLADTVVENATMFILQIAKEKLVEYLNQLAQDKNQNDTTED